MRRKFHYFVNGRGRHLTAALAFGLCCALFTSSPLLAGWVDDEYGDIFVTRPKPKPQPKKVVAKPVAAPVVQRQAPGRARPKASDNSLKPYRFPDAAAPLYPPVAPLGNSPMYDESVAVALGHYRAASKGEWLVRVYEANGGEPVWHRRGRISRDASAAIQILSEADSQGLNPHEYHIEEIFQAQQNGDLMLFDLLLTDNVLHYASHVRDGQYRPRDVDPRWKMGSSARADLAMSMAQAVTEQAVPRFMKQASPGHAYYKNLRRVLRDYTAIADSGGWPFFPAEGRGLKPGMSGGEVMALRARLAVTDGADLNAPQPSLYDDDLKLAVEGFQRRHGLNDDGVVGARTRQALAVPVKDRIRQIIASMERWRWLPGSLGQRYIIVNVPAFRLWYRENGEDKLTMRTVVGKTRANHQTPSFSTHMKYMVLNPNWNVPSSIVSAEMAPKASRNPGYFKKKGYTVMDRAGNVVDPYTVNWGQYSRSNRAPFRVVESSGAGGALGTVKFIFPNKHGVYLHDTQSKSLFKKDFRAYSHGCVRIEKPAELGSVLLGDRSPDEFSDLVAGSGKNRHINLEQSLPVYLLYMTAWADDNQVYFYDDIYRRDKRLVQAKTSKRG
jgi:murein L,D-transpeptidase YcbB/YkuD